MKILLLSSLFPHYAEPTLGVFVENRLRNLLNNHAVKAKVIAPVPYFPFKSKNFGRYGRAAQAPLYENRHGIDIYHPRFLTVPQIAMRWNPVLMYKAALKSAKALMAQGDDFDVIDAHYLYPDGVAAMMLADALNKPFVITARGSDVTEIGRNYQFARDRIMAAIQKSSKTITVSSSLKDELIEQGAPAEKVTVLRNGVDTQHYHEWNRKEVREGLSVSGAVMIYAGWLIERKRLDIVLDVTERIPELTTLIVGDGPLREQLEKTAKEKSIENRVLFLGQQTPTDMPKYYSAADVLLLPSDREGWANVLLEAQACGTPVVTRNVGAARDIVTNDKVGRVVDNEDATEIAAVVRTIIQSNTDRKYVCNHACRYSWDATSCGQYEIFQKAIIK
jgi:glycosyltransferase involved in cell wall biosynthesis